MTTTITTVITDTVPVADSCKERLCMWVWASDLKTQGNCDAMIEFAAGRMTDVFIFAIDDSVSPKTWLGTGILGASNATSIGGKTPWHYIYDELHAVGIKVHAWMWLGTFSYIGGATGVDTDIPNNSTYNDAGVWNYHNAIARAQLISEMEDFVDNNDVDGIHMNIESTTANIVDADITSFLTDLRAAIPSIEFSICTGASIGDDIILKFDTDTWLTNHLIDTLVLMGYYDDEGTKRQYTDSLSGYLVGKKLIAGIGAEEHSDQPSDFRWKWMLLDDEGYEHFAIFCWGNNIKYDSRLVDSVDYWLDGMINANTVQGDITKVTHVQGTSFTITVDGVNQTTAYADIADHTNSGDLKAHIEAAIGSENPAIWYKRIGSTVTYIVIGDWEP